MLISAIIVAAGKGERSGLSENKVFFKLGDKTVLEKTAEKFLSCQDISEIIIAASLSDIDKIKEMFSFTPIVKVVQGGATRTESVKNALCETSGEMVLIHDGARPYLTKDLIERVIDGVKKHGSAIAAVPSADTLAVTESNKIIKTVRDGYYRIQTPQGFWTKDIKYAYSKIPEDVVYTDDSAVYNAVIDKPTIVEGEKDNIKLTYKEDFITPLRVGVGYDLHRLVEGRKLILGGVEIAHTKGLLGHSDADVLTHAIMDALLSACSLRDIGYHFPDTDPQYEGISSIKLLEKVLELVKNEGYAVNNISACIMAEKPKLMPHIPKITENLATIIGIPTSDLGIGCTTMEGLGIVGREEGIAVSASCSLKKLN